MTQFAIFNGMSAIVAMKPHYGGAFVLISKRSLRMSLDMSRIGELITKFGGPSVVAQRIGKRPSVVSSWIKREGIPIKNWPLLMEIGISKDDLLDAHIFCQRHNDLEVNA